MFDKLVNVLKEVFWLNKSPVKRRASLKKKALPKKRAAVKRVAKKIVLVPKPAKKITAPPKAVSPKAPRVLKVKKPVIDPQLAQVGTITHYFERIKVAVLHVGEGSVVIGDKIHIIGPKTRLVQKVWSMQVDRVDVKIAKKGEDIGLKIDKPIEVGDRVYKTIPRSAEINNR